MFRVTHSVSRILIPLAAALLVTTTAVAESATTTTSTPTGVRTSDRSELGPAAARGVLVWSQDSRRRPGRYDLYVKRRGRPAFKVNRRGTQAFTGDIDGSTLAYGQQPNGGKSNIRFLNLDTGRHWAPAGVNTRRNFENQPAKTGKWLLFKRSRRTFNSTQRIILRNLATGRERLLATGDGGRHWAQTGRAGGRFVTYVKCRNLSYCNVFRYNVNTHRATKVPNARRRALYAASVTANGTVYYAKGSGIVCPSNASLWKFTRGGRKVKLATLGPRFDTAITSPVVRPDGSVDVFFDAFRPRRRDCGLRTADIYKVTVR